MSDHELSSKKESRISLWKKLSVGAAAIAATTGLAACGANNAGAEKPPTVATSTATPGETGPSATETVAPTEMPSATETATETPSAIETSTANVVTGPKSLESIKNMSLDELGEKNFDQYVATQKEIVKEISIPHDEFLALPQAERHKRIANEMEYILSTYTENYTDGVHEADSDEVKAVLKSLNYKPYVSDDFLARLKAGDSLAYKQMNVLMQLNEIATGHPFDSNGATNDDMTANMRNSSTNEPGEFQLLGLNYDEIGMQPSFDPQVDLPSLDITYVMKLNGNGAKLQDVSASGHQGYHLTLDDKSWTVGNTADKTGNNWKGGVTLFPTKTANGNVLVFAPSYVKI